MSWTTQERAQIPIPGRSSSRADRAARRVAVQGARAGTALGAVGSTGLDHAALWAEALCRAVGPATVSPRDRDSFSAQLAVTEQGQLRLVTLDADAHLIRCAAAPAGVRRYPGGGAVAMAIWASGTGVLVQSGRRTPLAAGDVAFLLPDRSFGLEFLERGRLHLLLVPRGFLPLPDERVLSGAADAAGQAVAPLLTGLAETLPRLHPGTGAWLAASLVEALVALAAPGVSAGASTAGELVDAVRAHIDDRLADPDLTPASIAAAHHISVRNLHRIFAQEGTTVGTWIRRRRLEAARRELIRSGPASPTIAAVAYRWGFVSASHFSRAFRQTYGMAPRAWRTLHAWPARDGRPRPLR
ncbi:helix-turn-helix domain-containing protein [Streptomyces sp. NPDC090021]|uniref:helix-turn-helix domain-containing protein n=1 Tax=Streptomyces sp. NPDC090021 TaxID=3365919 RepID=UPI003816E35F